jgi:hypothetical protein
MIFCWSEFGKSLIPAVALRNVGVTANSDVFVIFSLTKSIRGFKYPDIPSKFDAKVEIPGVTFSDHFSWVNEVLVGA